MKYAYSNVRIITYSIDNKEITKLEEILHLDKRKNILISYKIIEKKLDDALMKNFEPIRDCINNVLLYYISKYGNSRICGMEIIIEEERTVPPNYNERGMYDLKMNKVTINLQRILESSISFLENNIGILVSEELKNIFEFISNKRKSDILYKVFLIYTIRTLLHELNHSKYYDEYHTSFREVFDTIEYLKIYHGNLLDLAVSVFNYSKKMYYDLSEYYYDLYKKIEEKPYFKRDINKLIEKIKEILSRPNSSNLSNLDDYISHNLYNIVSKYNLKCDFYCFYTMLELIYTSLDLSLSFEEALEKEMEYLYDLYLGYKTALSKL